MICFVFIPIIFLWHPNWIGFLGIQPYWPLFWLLPWSMMHGSSNGLIFGLFLGLILDSVTIDNNFTQIPGLILCGVWFGRIKIHSDILVGHFRYGLICSIGSLLCGSLYFLQILFRNLSESTFLIFIPSIQNILAIFFALNGSSTDLTIPIGIFGGNKVLAGEDDTKSPTFISASFE